MLLLPMRDRRRYFARTMVAPTDIEPLLVGKLPPELLQRLLSKAPVQDPEVVLGPGIGLDCAVVAHGDELLVFKSDPVTFASDELGHYLVQVNANDLATTGATPRWLLATLLLPEGATPALAERIMEQLYAACSALGIALVGGHTEVTHGLRRPLAAGTLIGLVRREHLITPRGARIGDRLLLTKSVPIEGSCILAREFPERLGRALSPAELRQAQRLLFDPGISVVGDAQVALRAGTVTSMHDPTEGGLAAALWELAQASGRKLVVSMERVPVSELARRICAEFAIDPLATIASGSLLLTTPQGQSLRIRRSLNEAGIACAEIGSVGAGPAAVVCAGKGAERLCPWPQRDGLASVFDSLGSSPKWPGKA